MTQRSEIQHRLAEYKAIIVNRVANRLFSSKQSGLNGFLKRRLLPDQKDVQKREVD